MTTIDLIFLAISILVGLQLTKEIFQVSPFILLNGVDLKSETHEFLENMNDARLRKRKLPDNIAKVGLTLAKKKGAGKYDLIPQRKIDPKYL